MIPKVCYMLFYFFLSLVVASPVALQERETPPSLGINKQTIQSGTRNPWTSYGSYLTFDQNADIKKEHLVGIVEAAYNEMVSSASEADKKNLPNVMTAIQVGNEVFLSSNMKGGGGVYIYNMQEQPLANKNKPEDQVENGYGAFTDVLEKNAPDVKQALDALRTKSRELDTKNPQPNSQKPKSETQPAGNTSNNGGKGNQNNRNGSSRGSSRPNPNAASQELKDNRQTTFQHKNDANCGEVMASIRYRMVHKGATEALRKKKNPQPVIVAWSVMDKNGKKVGGIREPCEKLRTLDGDDACGLSWGCGAFTGPQGMDFDVVPRNTKGIAVTDAKFPKFTTGKADLPVPTIKKQTTRPAQSTSNNNGQSGSTPQQPATKPKDPAPVPKQPAPKQPAPKPKDPAPKQPPTQPAPAPKQPDTKKDPKKGGKKGGKKN